MYMKFYIQINLFKPYVINQITQKGMGMQTKYVFVLYLLNKRILNISHQHHWRKKR